MGNYYIIKINSLIDTFSSIQSGRVFKFKLETDSFDLINSKVLIGDFILASQEDETYFNFEVIETNGDNLKLKKTFEIEKHVNSEIDKEGSLIQIDKERYDLICESLFNNYKNLIPNIPELSDSLSLKDQFADWLISQGRYERVHSGNRLTLIEKLTEYEDAYEADFGITIFDYPKFSLKTIINELETNSIDIKDQIGDIDKRTVGNGSVKAILGRNNYIKFLKDLLSKKNHLKIDIESAKQIKIKQVAFKAKDFQESCEKAGLIYTSELINRYISSLATKPFVLLTGLSGSGKTKLAEAFARWICASKDQYALIPVGADWTNREPLLGYPNALKDDAYVKPDNDALDLLIRANNNENKPYFLILDEMNLSHVERYFADFLSTMETKGEIPLHKIVNEINGIPNAIKLPKNLFIIGTVNIDETTYMFSPKVLDRANTIEFRVKEGEIGDFLEEPSDVKLERLDAKGTAMVTSFIEIATATKNGEQVDENYQLNTAQIEVVHEFFIELQKSGAEFGYRSAFEISKLAFKLNELGLSNENDAIDIAIMQKMLPKLHGSRSKLSRTLKPLAKLCLHEVDDKFDDNYFNNFENIDFEKDKNIRYKLSFEKIMRMYRNAVENGFASYAEA